MITGGSRGIGRQVAQLLAGDGWRVAICGLNDTQAVSTASRISEEFGIESFGRGVDVCNSAALKEFSSEVFDVLGNPSVLICNAAVLGPVGEFMNCDEDDWNRTISVNLLGVTNTIRTFLPQVLRSSTGRVIVMSGGGVGGPAPMQKTSAYVVSKSAVNSLVESISAELVHTSTTINSVAPGSVATTFMQEVLEAGEDTAGTALFNDALRRLEAPSEEISPELKHLLMYLLGPQSSHVQGRLLSARWDSPEKLESASFRSDDPNLFRLRRIDSDLFYSRKDSDT